MESIDNYDQKAAATCTANVERQTLCNAMTTGHDNSIAHVVESAADAGVTRRDHLLDLQTVRRDSIASVECQMQ